jgi:hypothetical protein
MLYAALFLVCLMLSVVVTALLVVLLSDLVSFVREPSRGMPTCRRIADDVGDAAAGVREMLSARSDRRDPLR